MGMLVNGQWHDEWYNTEDSNGEFIRPEAQFRNWVTADGSAGPTGEAGFKAEAGRYHLYVSLACPWAHRTVIFRQLKGLEEIIGVSVVAYEMLEKGWTYDVATGSSGDAINHSDFHYQLYTKTEPNYSGRVTVPVLWDKKLQRIVNNESAEIIRMFNSAFNDVTGNHDDYYPEALREEIEAVNQQVYDDFNNGVYRAGFATSQRAYEKAYDSLFKTLDCLEKRLGENRYLTGERITEADWRLFTTLVRFDSVYYGHFKCNLKRIEDYPNLSNYLRELYQWQGIAETVNFEHIKKHYYGSHTTINPTGIVPKGPELDYNRPHNRGGKNA
jgi:putative glutathione S-transferase